MLGTVKDTTKGGVFGTIYPFGKTNMGDKLLLQTIWRAGGMVLNPDGSVAFNSPETIAAFDYVRNWPNIRPRARSPMATARRSTASSRAARPRRPIRAGC